MKTWDRVGIEDPHMSEGTRLLTGDEARKPFLGKYLSGFRTSSENIVWLSVCAA
jgi:hypothetical protein